MSDSGPGTPADPLRDTIWEAIALDQVTPEIADRMFGAVAPDHDEASGSISEQVIAATTRSSFRDAVLEVAASEAKLVLVYFVKPGRALVASGDADEASRRYETLVSEMLERTDEDRVVKLLLTKADLFRPVDPRIAIDAVTRVLSLRPHLVPGLLLLADLSWKAGDLVTAEKSYRSLLDLGVEPGDRAAIMRALAHVLARLGRRSESDALHADAIEILSETADANAVGAQMKFIADDAEVRFDYDALRKWNEWVLLLAEKTGDRAGAAATMSQLAANAAEHGDLKTATREFERAVKAFKRVGDEARLAWALWRWGDLEAQLGQLRKAEKLLEKALRLQEKLGEHEAAVTTLRRLAHVATHRKKPASADGYLTKAVDLAIAAGLHGSAGKILLGRAQLLEGRGREAEQRDYYRRASEQFDRAGDERRAAGALGLFGGAAMDGGDLESAESALERARAIFDRIGDRASLGGALMLLGTISNQRNDYGSAERRTAQAAAIFTEIGNQELEARA